jgi:hypothetical protein
MSNMALVSDSNSYQSKAAIDKPNIGNVPISIIFGKETYSGYLGAVIGTQVGERTDSLAWNVK